MEYNYLVLVEAVKVKDFLFSSNKLKSIRGASLILDRLNLKIANDLFNKYELKKTGKKIYFGGGNNKALFTIQEDANEFLNNLKREYETKATGVKLACVLKQREGNQSLADLMQKAMDDIIKIKNEGFSKEISANPFSKYCSVCGDALVNTYSKDIKSFLCLECDNKINEGGKINKLKKDLGHKEEFTNYIYNRFYQEINVADISLPDKINEIADKNNFIGFIYADGNRLGSFLRKFNSDYLKNLSNEEYIKQQANFSKALDDGTKKAVIDTIKEEFEIKEKSNCPLEFIIAGGDDLILLVPGNKALKVAKKFMEKFEFEVNNKLKEDVVFKEIIEKENLKITISTGVVISKPSYPMRYLFEYASQLQKEAKLRSNTLFQCYKDSKYENNFSTIDFDIISSSSVITLKEKRTMVYLKDDDTYLTLRPYIVANKNVKNISELLYLDHLIESVEEFKEVKFPQVKLRQLFDALYLEKKDTILECLRITSRLTREEHKNIIKKLYKKRGAKQGVFPWLKLDENASLIVTDIADIVEIYDFI